MGKCPWCHGSGYEPLEPGSHFADMCPDCNGTGYIPECERCGKEYYGAFCPDCYEYCDGCGEVKEIGEVCDNCGYGSEEYEEEAHEA